MRTPVDVVMVEIARSSRLYFWPIIAANVLTMTVVAGGDLRGMALFSLSLSCLASFGFLVNDLCDRRIDLANDAGHFERSAPATLRAARLAAAAFCGAGLALAWAVGPQVLAVAAGLAVGLAGYSPILRRAEVVPNVATAVFGSSPLWAPLLLSRSGGTTSQWWLVAAAVVVLVAREILMDVRDRHGDAVVGRRTLATLFGVAVSTRIGFGLTMLAVVPVALAVGAAATQLSFVVGLTVALVAIVTAGLLVVPAARIPRDTAADPAQAIQAYVRRSRIAMALVPVLGLLLSRLP